jgi:D-lactate dehydrogenase (cytochrome)
MEGLQGLKPGGGEGGGDARRQVALGLLQERFHNRFSDGQAMREQHGHTTTWLKNEPPDAVVFAQSEAEVAEIVSICAAHGLPVIPFGVGTSLEGHLNAPQGGVSIDLSGMNKILRVSADDLDCTIQPGVTRTQLNTHLRDTGLFFPIDPGADATLGGMAATGASGTNAVRYGTMKDNVLALKAVMADGSVVTTARRARKTSAGYDLTRLLVGSEGTLGVITEITLRLQGIPEGISGGVCPFPDVQSACDAVIATIQCGIPVARIELLDTLQVQASNAYSRLELKETPTLFVEFHGSEGSVAEQADMFGEIAEGFGGGPFDWATETERRTQLWQARHDAYWASLQLRPGTRGLSTDVCVPVSHLADCVTQTQADIAEMGLIAPIVGHVGDGNFHVLPLIDVENPAELAKAERFSQRLVERALAMDGTCTGEHGIGQGKMKYLAEELGDPAIAAMAAVKRALDPENILNPGKIVRL